MPPHLPLAVLFASSNSGLQRILTDVVWIYIVALVARALLSWFPPSAPGTALYGIVHALDRVTEPVLRPVRRLLPPIRAGGMAIDLSIIVTILILEIVVVNVIIRAL
jgi:YggT family protein